MRLILTVGRAAPEVESMSVTVDGEGQPVAAVTLVDDRRNHDVEVLVPAAP